MSARWGKNHREGALSQFLRLVRDGEVPSGSFLLVENLDRLSREEVRHALRPFLDILDAGITIVTLGDGQAYSPESIDKDYVQLISSLIHMGRAHEESVVKAERLKDAWKNKRALARQNDGPPITSVKPAWLEVKATGAGFELHPERAPTVKRIFEESASGIGAHKIACRLNHEKVRTFGKSKGWHSSYIKKILKSEAAIGRFQPHRKVGARRVPDGDVIEGYFPPVIDQDLWRRSSRAIASRRVGAAGRKGSGLNNLLSGLCRCGVCGGALHYLDKGEPPKGGKYLQCDGARRRTGCQMTKVFGYEQVEFAVLTTVDEADIRRVLGREKGKIKSIRAELEKLEQKRERIDREQALLVQVITGSVIDADTEEEVDDALSQKIRNNRAKLAGLNKRWRQLSAELDSLANNYGESAHDIQERFKRQVWELDKIDDERERYSRRAAVAQQIRSFVERIVFFEYSVFIHYRNSLPGCLLLCHLDELPNGERKKIRKLITKRSVKFILKEDLMPELASNDRMKVVLI